MKYTPLCYEVNLKEGFWFAVDSLYAALCELHDKRDARGLRYALVTVLLLIVLAKLAGEDHLRGIAQWVKLRQEALAEALSLAKPQAPHATTYSRVLSGAVEVTELERVVNGFFASLPGAGESTVISLDGKTLRGTIPAGDTRGLHLLAAYLPDEGWVLAQVQVERKENEIPAAIRVVKCLDLRNKIVTADALLTQRELSIQIIDGGGEYVWPVKDNQPQLLGDIESLFAQEPCTPGFSPCQKDFQTATTCEKGHGRLEKRTLTTSSMLQGYVEWPHAAQVFRLERRFVRVSDGLVMHEITYGITSLTAQEADPAQLLQTVRKHWAIETALHYRRDETFHEDRCRLKEPGAHAMAVLNNLTLGLLRRRGVVDVPDARRFFAANLHDAAQLVLQSLA